MPAIVALTHITTVERAAIGAGLALGIAVAAYTARWLSRSGVVAAIIIGTAAAIAGWSWGALLVAYFVASSLISRLGRARKEARSESIVAKGGRRDAAQVIANGGVFAVAAVASLIGSSPVWAWGALGALAASAADTWSTEIGLLRGGVPRSILNGTPVLPGESGGVTIAGTLGGIAGAGFIALCAAGLGVAPGAALATLFAGFFGTLADSLLGATVQERQYCDACAARTERAVHGCGRSTRRAGGIRGVDNDVVNTFATLAGFTAGALLALTIGRVRG